jgi:hypothetical protein
MNYCTCLTEYVNTVSLIENLLGVPVGILIEAQDGFNEQAQHFILRESSDENTVDGSPTNSRQSTRV